MVVVVAEVEVEVVAEAEAEVEAVVQEAQEAQEAQAQSQAQAAVQAQAQAQVQAQAQAQAAEAAAEPKSPQAADLDEENGPSTAGEEGAEGWQPEAAPGSKAAGVFVGESLQIFVDVDEEVGSVWAEATVGSVDSDKGEFMVLITEWDSLAKEDPAYEAAYPEGPYTAGEEGTEWRRPAGAASAKAAGAVRVQEEKQLRGQEGVTALEAAEAARRTWLGDNGELS